MPIFRLERSEGDDMSKAELIIAQETNLELEKHLENWLENSPRQTLAQEDFLWIGRQTSVTDEGGTIFSDLLGIDSEGNLVVAELKRGRTPRDVVAQLLDYAAWANELPPDQIPDRAENYFEKREEFRGKTFTEAFREVFDIPETDELPPLKQKLRLFVIAEEIQPRVASVCRFLRTSHGMDISCIAVSIFQTESGEVVVSTETIVGDEDFAVSKTQRQERSSSPSRPPRDKGVREVVLEAVQEFTGGDVNVEFTTTEIITRVLKKDPDFKKATVRAQLIAGCPNHGSYRHHSGNYKYYWKIGTGKFRLYDPEKDKVESDGEAN